MAGKQGPRLAADRAVYVQYADGQRYEVTNAAAAKAVHPDAEVVAYVDGSDLGAPLDTPKGDLPDLPESPVVSNEG